MSETPTEPVAPAVPAQEPAAEAEIDWKVEARKWETRAKENATAAKRLTAIEDAQKTETERAADRIAKAEAEVATVPAKVAEALRDHLIKLYQVAKEDEVLLTATEPELLLQQFERVAARMADRTKPRNVVPREGNTSQPQNNEMHEFTQKLFQKAD